MRINANIDLTVDDFMKQKIMENQMIAPFLMDAKMLVMLTSKCPNDNNFDKHLNDSGIPEPIVAIAKWAITHVGDDVTVDFAHPQLGVKANLSGEGLALAVRTALKFIKLNAKK